MELIEAGEIPEDIIYYDLSRKKRTMIDTKAHDKVVDKIAAAIDKARDDMKYRGI